MKIECIESSECPQNILDLYSTYKKQIRAIEKKKQKLSNNIKIIKELKIEIQKLIEQEQGDPK